MKRRPWLELLRSASIVAGVACGLVASCAHKPGRSFGEIAQELVVAPRNDGGSEMLAKAAVAVDHLKRMELREASLAMNAALQLAPRNSHLHFLNAFIYHLQAKQGDAQKNEMAIEGYQQALRLDPSNWIAREFLALAYLDHRKFDDAKAEFSEVLLMTPESTVSIYGLMVASYLTEDATTACEMADRFRTVSSQPHAGFLRSSVPVYASCGALDKAELMRAEMCRAYGGTMEVSRTTQRLEQWRSFHHRKQSGVQLAQAFTVPEIKVPVPGPATPSLPAAPATPAPAAPPAPAPNTDRSAEGAANPRMILVDVVLIAAQEVVGTSKGVNLLNALTLQLGSISGNLAAYSRVSKSTEMGGTTTLSTDITRAVTVPALSYSLNIANANSSVNEVLARPTLAAIEGLPSEFFSGTNLSAGVVSTSERGGTTVVPVEKRFGIKLAVTPTFTANGQVQLKVDAQRSSLTANADNPKVAYQLEIGEITANANVVMNMGDTLVLSGLSEKASGNTRDGVPILQDLPIIQYLFSNKKTNDIQRSVLILLTPRAPTYTAKNGATDGTRALRDRFGFSGGSPTNTEAVLNQLQTNPLFREFRQGDVTLERWETTRTTIDRLKQSLDFLYY